VAPTPGLLLLHAKCVRLAEHAEWNTWEDDVHLPALCGTGGAWAVTRFELTTPPEAGRPGLGFTHVTVVELDEPDVRAQVARILAVDDELRAAGRMHPAHAAIAAEAFVAHGPYGSKPAPATTRTGHILAHVLCTDPRRVAEWDRWYDEMHVPDMLACGAFGAMSRWHRLDPVAVGPNHRTLYDVTTPTVDEAVARSAAALTAVVAAGRKHECHTGGLTLTLRPTGRHGGAGVRRIG
jgi:hypothetical protein